MPEKVILSKEAYQFISDMASKYEFKGRSYYYIPYWFKVGVEGEAEVLTYDHLDDDFKAAMHDERRKAYKYK